MIAAPARVASTNCGLYGASSLCAGRWGSKTRPSTAGVTSLRARAAYSPRPQRAYPPKPPLSRVCPASVAAWLAEQALP